MKNGIRASLIALLMSSGAIMAASIASTTNDQIPHWLFQITIFHIVVICLFFSTMAGGIAWLVQAHKDPDEYGFGTTELAETMDKNHKCLLKVMESQENTMRKSLKRTDQMLYIQLFNARTRSSDSDAPFPEWAEALLKSGTLLDGD